VTDAVSVVVTAASLTVTASDASRGYGQTNPVFNGSVVGATNGDVITATYTCAATAGSPVGTYAIVPNLTNPETNYTVSLLNGTLTVGQAMPVVSWTNPAAIVYGTALTTNQLDATANVQGTFAYSPTNGTMLNSGTQHTNGDFYTDGYGGLWLRDGYGDFGRDARAVDGNGGECKPRLRPDESGVCGNDRRGDQWGCYHGRV